MLLADLHVSFLALDASHLHQMLISSTWAMCQILALAFCRESGVAGVNSTVNSHKPSSYSTHGLIVQTDDIMTSYST